MSLIDLGEGIIVDDSSGEIIEAPDGADNLALVVHRVDYAQRQVKAWEQKVAAGKAAILRGQPEMKARYGHFVATRRQSSRNVFDAERFRDWATGTEFTVREVSALLNCVTGADAKLLNGDLAAAVAGFTAKVPTKEFVLVEMVAEEAAK